ncbi:MAG: hypothetical protein JO362_03910 [Streptomycetaceae bacterium]|nr:hypothetical protein [Streptomycetaceae bacterium]
MLETRNDTPADRAPQPAAPGAGGGKHRGRASSAEEDKAPAHGRHRRPERRDQ